MAFNWGSCSTCQPLTLCCYLEGTERRLKGFKRKRQVDCLGAETGLPVGTYWLLLAWSCCHLPQTISLPTLRLSIPPFTYPQAALALLSAPSHPHDSRDPQAAGVDSTCQQRDGVATVSDSRTASVSDSSTLIYKFHTCACLCSRSCSVTHTQVSWHFLTVCVSWSF